MPKVILTNQAVSDIKILYKYLREKFGRSGPEYINSAEERLLHCAQDRRFAERFDKYEHDEVYIYTTEKGGQNYYYRFLGNDIELLHVSGHSLRKETVIELINTGITNGRSDKSITDLLKSLNALE
jgi:hypothetical protein